MEEKKLLRILIFIVIHLLTLALIMAKVTWAESNTESDQEWAQKLAGQSKQMVIDNFKDMMRMQGFDQDLKESLLKPRPVLQIFVSSSMNKELLKAYAKEASLYGGVLVFRGLPSGSFRKLTDLVMDITDDKYPCAMQIDDESFVNFSITTVPTIVLSKSSAIFSDQMLPINFDKISGNITIKAALEIFAQEGELAANAKKMLKEVLE